MRGLLNKGVEKYLNPRLHISINGGKNKRISLGHSTPLEETHMVGGWRWESVRQRGRVQEVPDVSKENKRWSN
jgi:hypothetical protein